VAIDYLLQILYSIISLYIFIITLRIIFSWFLHGLGNDLMYRISGILARLTDPYLNLFRRIRFLRLGAMDFSPLVGIMLLWLAQNLIVMIAAGTFSFAGVLLSVVGLVFNLASGIIGLFALITIIRIIGLFIRANSVAELWFRLDAFLQPLVLRFVKLIAPHSELPYGTALGIFLAGCFITSLGLRLLMIPLSRLIGLIPF
jgi:YggT family protein